MFVQVHIFGLVLAFLSYYFLTCIEGLSFCVFYLVPFLFVCLFYFVFYFSLIEKHTERKNMKLGATRNEDTLKRNLCRPPSLCLVLKQWIAIHWNSSWNLMPKERKYWIQLPFRREFCHLEEISQSSDNLQKT